MKRRANKGRGGLIRSNRLTTKSDAVYDLLAINAETGKIINVGIVKSVEEARESKRTSLLTGYKYYILENNTVLLELE